MQRVRGMWTAVTIGAVLACPAAAAAATPDGSAVLSLQPSGKAAKRLAAASVRIVAGGPAEATAGRIALPVTGVRFGGAPRLDHGGTLTLRKGKRSVTLRALRTALGTQPRVTAALGKRRITFVTLTPARSKPIALDANAGLAVGTGLRATLTRSAAKALRKRLKARSLRAGRLGTLDATGRLVPDPVNPSGNPPAPQPTPAPSPTPTPEPEPEPEPQPIGHTDWIASTLPGSGDLRSFTNYLLRDWAGIPPAPSGPGSVVASEGATRIDPANPYDHRLEILDADRAQDGSVRIEHNGQIDYLLPAHFIDNRIVDPEVVIAPGGGSAQVIASGHATSRDEIGAAPVPFTDEHLLDLDLTGIPSGVTEEGDRVWEDVPAVVAETGTEELGYAAGSAWGFWTITVPAEDTDPAAVRGTSSFAARPGWINYLKNVPPAGTVQTSGGTTESASGVFAAGATGHFSRATQTGTAELAGGVRYLKPAHGIDITISDTQVEIDGADSTISALVKQGAAEPARITMATLDLSAPVETDDGLSWAGVLASFTAEGAAVFGAAYAPGSEYGQLTLELAWP